MSLELAQQYAEDVFNNKIPACKFTKQAVQRFFDDIEQEKWAFDTDKAEKVLSFFPDFVRHVKGKLAGEPYELSGWESFILINLFGWVHPGTGARRFRTAYLELARKNSKSTFCSGIALLLTAFDKEGGAEVYSAATTRDQARIVFGDAQNMIRKSPHLGKVFGVHKLNIHHLKSASKFEPLSSDANSLDGLNIHGCIVDEIHAHKTRELWDVLETATGAREQPLIVAITTAGSNKHGIGYEQREYVTKVLGGQVQDDTYFGIIYTLDEEDDPFDEKNWIKANPNLGRSKRIDDMRRLAQKAQEMPSARNNFLTKHLNIWVTAESAWMDMLRWDKLEEHDDWPESGSDCYIGLDLAQKLDVCALVAVFRIGEKMHYKCKMYLPEERIHDKSRNMGNLYQTWADQGYLTLTDGDVIDYDYIEEDIRDLLGRYNVKEIGFDPWGSQQLAIKLSADGAPMVEIQQTVKNLSEPMKEVEKLCYSDQIVKDKNPMFDWMMSNVVVKVDRNENIFPNKEHQDNKIDGPVALFNAMNRYLSDDSANIDDFINNMIEVAY